MRTTQLSGLVLPQLVTMNFSNEIRRDNEQPKTQTRESELYVTGSLLRM